MINARCVCGHFSFIHSADIWQSSLTPLFSIRQACSTQQVAAEIVSLLKHWMQLKMLDPLPIGPPLTILWNLSSPLSTSLTHLTGHMQQSDTWINVESLYVMLCTASMLSCSHHWVQNICNLSLVYINKWKKKYTTKNMKPYLDHIKQTFQELHIMHILGIQIWCMLVRFKNF